MSHIREALVYVDRKEPIPESILRPAFGELLDPETSPVLTSAFLTALRLLGENAAILSTAVDAVIDCSIPFASPDELGPTRLDTCGTGGDHASTLNISTATAFVLAAAGVPVVKHGNRSATGKSGSSDVLESLGIRTSLSPYHLLQIYKELNFAFLFAPAFHPALKNLAPIRKLLPFRTIFNLVGPLANPARPTHQLLGVADYQLAELFAEVLRRQGVQKALIISAQDGLDEVSLGAPTQVLVVKPDGNETHLWHPEMTFGMKMIPPSEIRVDSPQESARRIRAVFAGRPENQADEAYIVVNAAAALWLTGKADNMINSVSLAREIIQSGTTLNLLENYTAKSLM